MSESANPDFSVRDPATGVNELFSTRWSPRTFKQGAIDPAVLTRIFDAARWSPSCFNEQPWRFFVSSDESFNDFLGLLVDSNQAWAKDASVIGFLVTKTQFDRNGKKNNYAHFDCGAAWMAMTLQAKMEGLYTHGMGGIKHDAVATHLNLKENEEAVIMGFVIGYLDEASKSKEVLTTRKPLSDTFIIK